VTVLAPPEFASATLFDLAGGEPTLDEVIVGVWERLAAGHVARCPACEGEMRPEYGARSLPIGGRCGACASVIT
jgi:hypothetical protein